MSDETSDTSTDKADSGSKVRDLAGKGVGQARDAMDMLLNAARSASDSIQSSTNTADSPQGQAVQRGFGFAKENISAIFDFAQKLVQAPSLKDAVQMQSEFVREQTDVMKKQVEELKDLNKTSEA